MHSNVKTSQCDECESTFTNQKDLESHRRSCSSNLKNTFLVHKRLRNNISNFEPISDRLCWITLIGNKVKKTKITILKVFMQTKESDDEEVEEIYDTLESIIHKIPNQNVLIVQGDFNSKTGN